MSGAYSSFTPSNPQTSPTASSGSLLDALSSFFQPGQGAVNSVLLRNPNAATTPADKAAYLAALTSNPDSGASPLQAQQAQQAAQSAQATQPAPVQQTPRSNVGSEVLPTQNVNPSPVAQVNAQPGMPSPSDYNADGTQASGNAQASSTAQAAGLLQQVTQAASQDPGTAKGILGALGAKAQEIGQKLTSLNPAQSQALMAAGASMLAHNNGTENLGQLIGDSVQAGNNQMLQSQINQANVIKARADAAASLTNAQANMTNAQSNAYKPTQVEPGNSVVTPAGLASGQAPAVSGAGVKPVGAPVETQNPDGSIMQQQMGYVNGQWGPIGPPTVKQQVDVGALTDGQRTAVNAANAQAQSSATLLNHTQGFLRQLSPTMLDANGNSVPNPDYVNVPGGLQAQASQYYAKLFGNSAQGQVERQQIMQTLYQAQLQNYKAGVGGRLTNADISMLQRGMPPENASGQYLAQWMGSYAKLLEDKANQDQAAAAFVSQNRGDQSPLRQPFVYQGQTVPAGTSFQSFVLNAGKQGAGFGTQPQGQQPSNAQGTQPGQNQPTAQVVQQGRAALVQLQTAARQGNQQAQQILQTRGLNW